MTSAAPARKPYRKAPPQHRESRHTLPVAPPAPQHDINQVNQHSLNTPPLVLQRLTHLSAVPAVRPHSVGLQHDTAASPLLLSDSELDISSLSSLEVCIPPPPLFRSQSRWPPRIRTTAVGITTCPRSPVPVRKPSPSHRPHGDRHQTPWTPSASVPRSILKQPAASREEHAFNVIRKSRSVELLDGKGRGAFGRQPPTRSLDRSEHRGLALRRSSDPPSPSENNWKMQVLEEKVRFSNFLDEITCQVMSPAHLTLLGRTPPSREHESPTSHHCRTNRRQRQMGVTSAERTRLWDNRVAAMQRPGSLHQPLREHGAGHLKSDITEGVRPKMELSGVVRRVKMEVLGTKEPQKHKPPVSNQSVLAHITVGPDAPPRSSLCSSPCPCPCSSTSSSPLPLRAPPLPLPLFLSQPLPFSSPCSSPVPLPAPPPV